MPVEFDPSNPLRVKRSRLNDDDEEGEQSGDDSGIDDISNDIGRKNKKSRGVNAQEYDEDSSDPDSSGDEDGDADEHKDANNGSKKEVNGSDDDDDMFASDDDEKDDEKETTNKKNSSRRAIKTMNIETFQKENELNASGENSEEKDDYFAHEGNGRSDDDDDDDEDDDENEKQNAYFLDQETEHYIKPKKGPTMDSFSLKNETETGVFDKEGNYYEAAESDDDEVWQDVKKKDIKRAKLAQEQRKLEQNLKNQRIEEVEIGDILKNLIALLEPVETPMEALGRLNRSRIKVNRRKNGKKLQLQVDDEAKEKEKRSQVEITNLTEYCEVLIANGFKDTYELEREELMLKYKEETGKPYPRDKKELNSMVTSTVDAERKYTSLNSDDEKNWEFRWIGDTQVNGPYSRREVMYWKDNYFYGRAEVRQVGEDAFVHISETQFD